MLSALYNSPKIFPRYKCAVAAGMGRFADLRQVPLPRREQRSPADQQLVTLRVRMLRSGIVIPGIGDMHEYAESRRMCLTTHRGEAIVGVAVESDRIKARLKFSPRNH